MADQTIDALAEEVMRRELAKNPDYGKPKTMDLGLPSGSEMKPLSPETAAMMGALVDAASTYSFLRRGTGSEGNPMYGPLKDSPAGTAAAVAASALAMKGIRELLRRGGQRSLADMLAGGMGSVQFGVGAQNFQSDLNRERNDGGSTGAVLRKISGARR